MAAKISIGASIAPLARMIANSPMLPDSAIQPHSASVLMCQALSSTAPPSGMNSRSGASPRAYIAAVAKLAITRLIRQPRSAIFSTRFQRAAPMFIAAIADIDAASALDGICT